MSIFIGASAGSIQQPPPQQQTSVRNLIENRSVTGSQQTLGTFVTLESSSPTVFSGRPVLFLLNASAFTLATNNTKVEFAIQIDAGADNSIAQFLFSIPDRHRVVSGAIIITPAAGSHTINLRWRRVSGTGTLGIDPGDQILLYAVET